MISVSIFGDGSNEDIFLFLKDVLINSLSCSQYNLVIFMDCPISSANSIVISSIQSTISSVPQVPELPIKSGILASSLAFISIFHSDFIADLEYLDVPEPREYGPLSVEPPSILMISGFLLRPFFNASISKPNPNTPDGTSTFEQIIYYLLVKFS